MGKRPNWTVIHEGWYDSEVVIPLLNLRKCLFFEENTVWHDYLCSFCEVCEYSTWHDYESRVMALVFASLFLLDYYSHHQFESLVPKKCQNKLYQVYLIKND